MLLFGLRMCRSMRAMPGGTSRRAAAGALGGRTGSRGGVSSTGMHASRVGVSTPVRRMYSSALLDIGSGTKCPNGAGVGPPVAPPAGPRHSVYQLSASWTSPWVPVPLAASA